MCNGACIDKVENYKVLDKLKSMTISVTRIRLGIHVMQNPLNLEKILIEFLRNFLSNRSGIELNRAKLFLFHEFFLVFLSIFFLFPLFPDFPDFLSINKSTKS